MKCRFIIQQMILLLPCMAIVAVLPPPFLEAHDSEPGADSECVVLLHGLGRTAHSMDGLARALKTAGFDTINLDYPSRDFPIETLAMDTVPRGIRHCQSQGAGNLHFVTHSMGGILLRYFLTRQPIDHLGRVVMLSPPNQGSEIVDELKDNVLYRWYNGPAGQQLGTEPDGFVAGLGPVDFPLGVITGNTHAIFDGWFAGRIPGEDDGKVSVERAKVEGMTDFLVLPYSHPFIMTKEAVAYQTIYFLRHGRFHHPVDAHGGK